MERIEFELRGGEDDYIQLIQLLKAVNLVGTGADAQAVVMDGLVKRNGEVEIRKRAKCVVGDIVELDGVEIVLK